MTSKTFMEDKTAKGLLGRKFVPMAGAALKRTGFVMPSSDAPAEQPASKSSNRFQASSRSGTASKKNVSDNLQIIKITKDSACKETLMSGYPQSYIDLFYILHGHFIDLEVRDSNIIYLKDRLITAEKYLQNEEPNESFKVYYDLGVYFDKQEKFDAATYFYERCAGIAGKKQLHLDEAKAYQGLGNCAYQTKDIAKAIQMFERGASIAESNGLKSALLAISKSLTEVYRLEADKLEDEGRISEALDYHMKCLNSSMRAEDLISQGNSSFRVGMIYFKQENYFKALEYLKKYLELSRTADYIDGITNALSKLAATYQAMGNMPQAIQHLEQLNHEASESGRHAAEAEAALNLGLVYQKQGQYKKSVEFLEKHFNLARKLQDRSLIDAGRVHLGVAQANCSIGNYSNLLNSNLQKLILWKNKRNKF